MRPVKTKLLVADDSRVVVNFITSVVLQLPEAIDIVWANNGRTCMERLAENDIDLAFIDVNMPEMSGTEAVGVARLKGIKTFVTLMSAKGSEARFALARELRVYEYLIKPFEKADVQAILRNFQRARQRTRALIVDDSATVRLMIRKLTEASVFRIECSDAADGETAIARCNESDYDIVFLDYNMPGLNGHETLARLLERNPATRVIMMSAERHEERERQALALGALDFLHKPFLTEDVDRVLYKAYGLRMPGLASFQEPAPVPA